jgi:hypothetical protein
MAFLYRRVNRGMYGQPDIGVIPGSVAHMDKRYSVVYFQVMGKNKSPEDLAAARRLLEDEGWIVKRPNAYVRKTVDLDESIISRVEAYRQQKRLTLRECIEQALADWLDKR